MTIKELIQSIKWDLPKGQGLLKTFLVFYFFNPTFRLLLNHRIGKFLYRRKSAAFRLFVGYYRRRMILKRHCDISYNCSIGKNLKLPHPIGIVIGDGVEIKDNVMIFQQVTFGSHGKKGVGKQYPVVEKGVKIFAGAKIIGGITIGENAIVGANAVVNIDVPANCIAVGIPCKIINR